MQTRTTETLLLANSLPLGQIQIDWQSNNLDECLEDAARADILAVCDGRLGLATPCPRGYCLGARTHIVADALSD